VTFIGWMTTFMSAQLCPESSEFSNRVSQAGCWVLGRSLQWYQYR